MLEVIYPKTQYNAQKLSNVFNNDLKGDNGGQETTSNGNKHWRHAKSMQIKSILMIAEQNKLNC